MNNASTVNDLSQKPLSVFDWIVVFFLLGIPILGFLAVIYWSFADGVNLNKKNFSKAMLILMILTFALAIIFAMLFGQLFSFLNFSNPVHI